MKKINLETQETTQERSLIAPASEQKGVVQEGELQ